MSRIQVTPERLFEASREVERTRAQMGDTREELVRLIRWMESMWSGMVRERFLERFEETQPRMIETLEHLTHIAKELRDIGVRFQQADEMSGAAVAGSVATMSIGLKAANSPSNKGYRMVYNSQWHMWLPVNEKGVTDQAALQAFEKDKGNLDISTLNQGPGPVEPIDQDLIQLQIEALELRVNPFTGEPVTDSYAKMMIASLKWSQIVGGIGLVVGSAKGSKGPYKGRGTSAALDKVKQTIRDAKVKREKSSKGANGMGKSVTPSPVYQKVNYGDQFTKKGRKKVLRTNVEYTSPDGYTYRTDSQGRIIESEGTLVLGKGDRSEYAQRTVGKGQGRQLDDDGGHLIGAQFKGPKDIDNLVPQNSQINRSGGKWYEMETEWSKALHEIPPKKVTVKIEPIYSGSSMRPDSFKIIYQIGNKRPVTKRILNKVGG